jgi:putative ABC transport system ATP-binding protein
VPELTLKENISLPLELGGTGRRETSSRVDELIELLELADCASRRPRQVSGGQAQRCAVARAVATKPAIVFADEPTGALDSSNRDRVLALLLEQVEACGALLIAVTHDPSIAARFDRRVSLVDGQIVTDTDVYAAQSARI